MLPDHIIVLFPHPLSELRFWVMLDWRETQIGQKVDFTDGGKIIRDAPFTPSLRIQMLFVTVALLRQQAGTTSVLAVCLPVVVGWGPDVDIEIGQALKAAYKNLKVNIVTRAVLVRSKATEAENAQSYRETSAEGSKYFKGTFKSWLRSDIDTQALLMQSKAVEAENARLSNEAYGERIKSPQGTSNSYLKAEIDAQALLMHSKAAEAESSRLSNEANGEGPKGPRCDKRGQHKWRPEELLDRVP